MFEEFSQILTDQCFLKDDKPVVLGLSGGADSLCLFDLMVNARIPVVAAHFNHNLRPDSGKDADAIIGITRRYGVRCLVGSQDVAGFAEKNSCSIENAARILRYQFLFDQADVEGAQAVMVAHQADDQVETVLLNLLRGTGLAGLKGMEVRLLPNQWSETIPLLRPLLSVWRADIERYCRENGLVPLVDLTNQDPKYTRNRVRLELVPLLAEYNPRFKQAVLRMRQIIKDDHDLLQGLADQVWNRVFRQSGPGYVCFSTDGLLAQPLSLQRAAMRKGIELVQQGLQDVGFDLVDHALHWSAHPKEGHKIDLGLGLFLLHEGQDTWLAKWEVELPTSEWPQVPTGWDDEVQMQIPSQLQLPGGWQFELTERSLDADTMSRLKRNRDPFQAWMDADSVGESIFLRTRQPGDLFQPFGMQSHSQKLSDFMVNVKLAKRARQHWPLVCTPGEILWVPGFNISHSAVVQESSKRILHLSLIRRAA